MPIVGNRHYNDPALGQAFSNIASMFAPPSAQDTYAYARAKAASEEAARIADFYGAATTMPQEDFDRRATALGVYNPTQSWRALEMGDATARYGVDQNTAAQRYGYDVGATTSRANNAADNERAMQLGVMSDATQRYGYDVGAETSRANNAADNTRALQIGAMNNQQASITSLYGALNQGQVRPAVPAEVAGLVGLPAIEAAVGAPKPLSETELNAAILGQMPMELQQAAALGNTPIEQIVTPDGVRNVTRMDAIGQEPYINRGAEAAPKITNYRLPDGSTGSALIVDGKMVDAANGQPLPQGTITFTGNLQGGAAETGLGPTIANATAANNRGAEVTRTLAQLDLYEGLLDRDPGVIGLVGAIRGTAQDLVASAEDLAASFGKSAPELMEAAQDIRTGLSGVAPELFNPAIPQANFIRGTLAYALARTENPSGEVSRQAYERALERLGGGAFANSRSAKAQISSFRDTLQGELEAIGALRDPETARTDVGYPGSPEQPAAAPKRLRYNPATGDFE